MLNQRKNSTQTTWGQEINHQGDIKKAKINVPETILIQLVGEHDAAMAEKIAEGIKERTKEDFQMIAVRVEDWNADLSPWKAPAAFGKEDFAGGAGETLKRVLQLCTDPKKKYFIGGYSLAGLFALWAAYQTDIFYGVAAASPSVWFPGFVDYMKSHDIKSQRVYLSLGDKEEKTRNPVLSTVGNCIREVHDYLKEQKIACMLEWNPGNHFKDTDQRVIKAFANVIEMREE